ncbi:hypothetical protein HK102_009002, partial [Quaeritorhiza haematococci]
KLTPTPGTSSSLPKLAVLARSKFSYKHIYHDTCHRVGKNANAMDQPPISSLTSRPFSNIVIPFSTCAAPNDLLSDISSNYAFDRPVFLNLQTQTQTHARQPPEVQIEVDAEGGRQTTEGNGTALDKEMGENLRVRGDEVSG